MAVRLPCPHTMGPVATYDGDQQVRKSPIRQLPCRIGHAVPASASRPTIRSMISVVIPALSGTASMGTAGLLDALNKADLSHALLTGRPAARVFEIQLVGLHGGSVSCRDGVSLHPVRAAADITAPDLVVVPGLDDDLARSFDENRGWVPWLRTWHAAGSRGAGSCTGAVLGADSGPL